MAALVGNDISSSDTIKFSSQHVLDVEIPILPGHELNEQSSIARHDHRYLYIFFWCTRVGPVSLASVNLERSR